MTAPDDMTLVIPLRAKNGMTLPDVIRRVGASQLAPEVSALFQPVSSA